MPPAKLPSYAFQRTFTDFDELAENARQWSLDLRQLDHGTFRGDVLQFGISSVHVGEARFCRALVQKGAPPTGLRTIGVAAKRNVRFSWRGHQVCGQDLVIFPRGADLTSVSTADFHVYTCSFPEDLLATLSDSLFVAELDDLCGDRSVFRCRDSAIASVRKCLGQLCATIRSGVISPADEDVADRATRELPERLLSAIVTSHSTCSPETTCKRELALLRAVAYIEQFAHEDITVRDLCRISQVSQRTLEYAFAERFGLTPKAFLTGHRLNAVRRELRAADPTKAKVTDIANRWGFWHLGQFAADYRAWFDELPSQTLRRVISPGQLSALLPPHVIT